MSEKHSKLPFRAEPCGNMRPNEWLIIAPDGEQREIKQIRTVGRVFDYGGAREARANAQYIVKACNAYPELVNALKLAREALYLHTGPDEPGDMPDPLQEMIADALRVAGEEV